MFKYLIIYLDRPICKCKEEKLSLTISVDTISKNCSFIIECEICQSRVSVAQDKLRLRFNIDKSPKSTALQLRKPKEPEKPDINKPLPEFNLNDRRFLKSLRIAPHTDNEDSNGAD